MLLTYRVIMSKIAGHNIVKPLRAQTIFNSRQKRSNIAKWLLEQNLPRRTKISFIL